MKKFSFSCINKTNTKYFTYFRFLIIGIILIPVLFIFSEPIPLAEAQGGFDGAIIGSVSPEHATNTIFLSGTMQGPSESGGYCPDRDACSLRQAVAYRITALVYSIDDGASVSMTLGATADWHQTVTGRSATCTVCQSLIRYGYEFHRTINISSYPQSTHTLVLRATTDDGDYIRVTYTFDNVLWDFNIAPEIDAGSIYQSGSNSIGVRIGRLQGPAEPVTLSAAARAEPTMPAEPTISISFSPTNSCTPNDECVRTMTIQTQATTPVGTYTITITGASPSKTHDATYTLYVAPQPSLIVNVTADPSSGVAPLGGVEIIVDTGGWATGPIDIRIDCGEDETGDWEYSSPSPSTLTSTSFHFAPGCDYYNREEAETSYMVLASVSRGGYTATNTAMVTTRLAELELCARLATGGGAVVNAGIRESWATSSIEVYEAGNYHGPGHSLRGGFYTIARTCTYCSAESGTDYVSGEIKAFEYRFDDIGTWTPLQYWDDWGPHSVYPATPLACISWSGCCLTDEQMYYMYLFGFTRDVSTFSVGDHKLNLRAKEEWSHGGGPADPDGYHYENWTYQSIPFAKNGWPGISLVSPENGSYVSSGNPDPTFSARVTDPNINQPLFAHFQIVGFGEGNGSITTTPGISSWGPVGGPPVGIPDDTYIWRVYAEDSIGATSSWSGYWSFTKDTMLPYASISYPLGSYDNTVFHVYLIELDERTSVARGDVQMRSRLINGTWSAWGAAGLPNSGITVSDFDFTGTRGYEYEFQYRATDGAGNVSDWVSPGTVAIASNVSPTATNLSLNNSDFCSTSPAYFFSWVYADADLDTQNRFDFQVDDSGASFPSPEIDRTFSVSYPSPTTNNQAAIVLMSPQVDHLSYNRTYNWRVRVSDSNNLDSGWVSGVPFSFLTPTHRSPSCNFTWSPINPNPGENVNFIDTSICYDTSGNPVSCTNWNWIFMNGSPATSTQKNPITQFTVSGTKDVTLQVIDSFGSTCSITRQVIVSLPMPKWKEIRPWQK